MGSFDGWSEGEHLSPEYTGSYTMFSTTLMLTPGRFLSVHLLWRLVIYLYYSTSLILSIISYRYEIKFLVDREWKLSPEFPTVGEGLMENNLLIVE